MFLVLSIHVTTTYLCNYTAIKSFKITYIYFFFSCYTWSEAKLPPLLALNVVNIFY